MITETSTAVYLGQAQVIATTVHRPGWVSVRLPGGENVLARMALALPYSPQPNDEVLVIRQESSETFVIGVLNGHGVTSLQVPGDLTLAAPQGNIRLVAGKAIAVRGGESIEFDTRRATLRASRLNLLATTLVERVGNAYTWITGLLQMKSRRMRMVSDEGWTVRAERAQVKTTGNTCINGKTVHLG